MPLELFAGSYVSDFGSAKAWYTQLFGREPDWEDTGTEAVWELAEGPNTIRNDQSESHPTRGQSSDSCARPPLTPGREAFRAAGSAA